MSLLLIGVYGGRDAPPVHILGDIPVAYDSEVGYDMPVTGLGVLQTELDRFVWGAKPPGAPTSYLVSYAKLDNR